MTQKKLTAKRYNSQLADLQKLFDAAMADGDHKLGLKIKQQMQDLDVLYLGPASSAPAAPELFATQKLAVEHLKSLGFKINTTTFGHHVKDRNLVIKGDHGFARKDLEAYALNHLEQDIPIEEKEASREAAQTNQDLKNDLLRIKRDQATGMLKPIAEIEEQWVARYSLFEDAIKNTIHGKAKKWVLLVGGDEERTADLVDEALADIDLAFDHLSQAGEVDVSFAEEVV